MGKRFFPVTEAEAKKQGIQYSSRENREAIFPQRLRKLRKERCGCSQAVLSSNIQISKSTLGLYETGDTLPDAATLRKLADEFNVSADWLIGRTEDYRTKPPAVDELGLSVEAVHQIQNFSKSEREIFSRIVSSIELWAILNDLADLHAQVKTAQTQDGPFSLSEVTKVENWLRNRISAPVKALYGRDYIEYTKHKITSRIAAIIEKEIPSPGADTPGDGKKGGN